jgi:hypothetical protein
MYRSFIGCLLILVSLGVMGSDDDWGDIEPLQAVSNQPQEKTLTNYWDEHVYGGVSGMISFGANHSRLASEVKLGISDHWKVFKWVLEGAHRQNRIETQYTQGNTTGTEILKNETFGFRQAYVDIYPIQNVTLSLGKQTIVWGQLDTFSPVDFLLPIDVNPTGFSLIKADNRMPQTTAQIVVYPLPNLELTAYYFPYFEESALFKLLDLTTNYVSYDNKKYYTQKIMPSGSEQSSYAARAVWYSPSATVALTYYQGFNNVFPEFRSKYLGQTTNSDNKTSHEYRDEYGYYPKKGVGAEVSIPLGQLALKAEVSVANAFHYLSYEETQNTDIINAINQDNDGYNTVPVYQGFFAVGIDADFDHWFYNAYLMNITIFKNPAKNDVWDAYASVYGEPKFRSFPVFPTLNIGRYIGDEKKGAYGVAAGYFTGSLGAFVYVSNQINESLSWGISGDIGFNFSDLSLLIAQSEDSDDSNDNKEYAFTEPKVTLGLGYKL